MELAGWATLPDKPLLEIFFKLEEKDMIHASSTCTRWRRFFYEPHFWRSVTFDFNVAFLLTDRITQMLQVYLETIGPWVQDLTIVCPSLELLEQRLLVSWVTVILDTLCINNREIQTFRIQHLKMEEIYTGFEFSKCELIVAICRFIESQTCLQTLVLSEALLPTTFGHTVMSSLASSPSVDTLKQLDIFCLYGRSERFDEQDGQLIRSSLMKCTKLQDLKLNINLLKAVKVDQLVLALRHCLRTLEVNFFNPNIQDSHHYFKRDFDDIDDEELVNDRDKSDEEENNDDNNENINEIRRQRAVRNEGVAEHDMDDDESNFTIGPKRWKQAARSCPQLRVSVELNVWEGNLFDHIVPTIPVSHLTITGLSPAGDDKGINDVLNHITKCSFSTLEEASFLGSLDEHSVYEQIEKTSRREVVNFLRKYPNISIVKISADLLSFAMLENVKVELLRHYGMDRNVLEVV